MIYRKLVLVSAVTLALAGAVSAEQKNYIPIERSADSPYQLRASDLLGMDVENMSGDEIGKIDDLIISGTNAPMAVISVGGVLGIGEKLVAIPYNELNFDSERKHVIYNTTEEQLGALPEFHYLKGEITWSELRKKRLAVQDKAKQVWNDAKDKTMETVQKVEDSGVWHQVAGNWNQVKGKAKQQWGKLTDDELAVVEGNRDILIGKIQKLYGISKEEAEQQVDTWAKTL